jgi:magnesium-transporting ATPase (P-type)
VTWSWNRWAGLAGVAFVALYVGAFTLGIEVGESDQEILDYYADSGHQARELIAFFVISAAVLAFALFASALRSTIAAAEGPPVTLAAIAWIGATGYVALTLAGNAVSRATAFAASDTDLFDLDANSRRLLEAAGVLLLASGALAAILFVVAVSVAAVRYGILPRWLGWAGFLAAALLPLAVVFVGFLVLFLWVLAVGIALVVRPTPTAA